MDHLIEHDGQPIPSDTSAPSASTTAGSGATAIDVDEDDEDAEALRQALNLSKGIAAPSAPERAAEGVEAKSIKCAQCGKTFKNTTLANFHAEKSGHDQFEESVEEVKPLTEEEKAQKLADLRAKMSEKRAKKATQDAEENKANEALRRKAGKDVGAAREELKAKEAIKEAAQRRQEKLDDAKAKAAIRAQIEVDKRERAERTRREKEAREGGVMAVPASSQTTPQSAAAGTGAARKDHKETRLQIRLASGGQPYVTSLPSDATLMDVAEFLAGQVLSVDVETVNFAMHFPRKQFSRSDFGKTLKELGLTPSAVLIAS